MPIDVTSGEASENMNKIFSEPNVNLHKDFNTNMANLQADSPDQPKKPTRATHPGDQALNTPNSTSVPDPKNRVSIVPEDDFLLRGTNGFNTSLNNSMPSIWERDNQYNPYSVEPEFRPPRSTPLSIDPCYKPPQSQRTSRFQGNLIGPMKFDPVFPDQPFGGNPSDKGPNI